MDDRSTQPPWDDRSAGRPRIDLVSFVIGLICTGIALVWLLVSSEAVGLDDLSWLIPLLLIGTGGLGIAASIRRRS